MIIGYSIYPIINKVQDYKQAQETYIEYRKNKEDTEVFSDWITINDTNIDYPIAYGQGNDYYLNHTIDGKQNPSGSIFFEEDEEPYDGINTIIYGHAMNDGTMFNNLHDLKKNATKFRDSKLILRHNDEIKTYKPLGLYITNEDWFFYNLDNMTINDAVDLIREKSKYKVSDIEITEESHIITLMTCEYSEKGNRLFLFYITD